MIGSPHVFTNFFHEINEILRINIWLLKNIPEKIGENIWWEDLNCKDRTGDNLKIRKPGH